MQVNTGYFAHPKAHHKGRFRVFRFKGMIEFWAGHYWVSVSW